MRNYYHASNGTDEPQSTLEDNVKLIMIESDKTFTKNGDYDTPDIIDGNSKFKSK